LENTLNKNGKKVAFHNLGCKVNTYELDAMTSLLVKKGYETVPFTEKADIYIVNTCSVTNIADRKSRQMLSRAKTKNPEAIVVAVGCYVDTRAEELIKNEGIDLCIGNNRKGQIAEILEKFLEEREEDTAIIKADDKDAVYEQLHISGSQEHSRAFIKIQDGCNQFCTYCIIPFARGRARSRSMEDIVEEIRELTEKGFREFVINGIHISSYGADFIYETSKADQFNPEALLELLSKINSIEKVERIRLGSLEPRIITKDFVSTLSKLDKICPHFHLSLQSGCDETLKRMNRHYSSEEYAHCVEILREYYEHPAITTDVIVGFPGEDEDEFSKSRDFVDKIKFFEMHIFKYSKRQGTIAATMKQQLTDKEKSLRSDVLESIDKNNSKEFKDWYIGKDVSVLIEESKVIDGEEYSVGHTKQYVKIAIKADLKANELATVNITGHLNDEYMLAR